MDKGVILKNKGYSSRTLFTTYGKISYKRTLLAPFDKDSAIALAKIQKPKYVCPLDDYLGVDGLPFKITVKMMTNIAKECIRASSYERAVDVIKDHYGVTFSTATVRSVTDFVGAVIFKDDQHKADEAEKTLPLSIDRRKKHRNKNDVLYIEADGAMVNTRRQVEGTSWMECKIGLVFHAKDIHSWKTKTGATRRQITKKSLVGYIGSYKIFRYHLLALARQYNYQYCTQIVFISDGADWIHTIVTELFPDAIHILDLSHVKEHVGDFGKWINKDADEASKWIEKINKMIEESQIEEVLKTLEPYANTKCPDNVLNLYKYISNHKECMDYKKYKSLGYFVGSGASESANKYVMQNRMKLQGMRWNKETGQGVLSLKARMESGCWHEVESLLEAYCNRKNN